MIFRRTASVVLASGVVAGSVVMGAAPALADHGDDLFAVNINNTLFETPRLDPTTIIRSAAITGLQGGETIVGIDFRPVDGEIYGITNQARVYRIEYRGTGGPNPFATATFLSTLTDSVDGSPVSLNGVNFGVNFNPVADRLRVVADTSRQNLRINVDTGVTVVDTPVAYATGDSNETKLPKVSAVAYTNPVPGATSTELVDIDAGQSGSNDIISLQDPPNAGTLTTLGNTKRNSTRLVGYDIDVDGFGVASLVGVDGIELVQIDLHRGTGGNNVPTTSSLGFFPDVVGELRDLALAIPDPDGAPGGGGPTPVVPEFPLAALAPVLGLGLAGAMIAVRRRREV